MKLAIYHPWIYLKGGIERTLIELLTRSRHEWTVFTNHYAPEATFPEFRQLDVRELPAVSVRRDAFSVARAIWTLLRQPVDFSDYDALFVSCEGIGDVMALRAGNRPVACLCFTPLKAAHDPHARKRLFEDGPRLAERAGLEAFKLLDRWAWRRYRRVLCVSEEVRRRVLAAGLAPAERIEVIHPGVDIERLQPSDEMQPFFLVPGRIMWTKNVGLAIDAFQRFRIQHPDGERFRLVIAGMVDEKSRPLLEELARRADADRAIEFVESPSDDVLFDLYARCQAVVFTSPNEDWGLVPLEAMAFARPVIAVDRGGPRESVVHGETGFLCDETTAAFAVAMARLADPETARRYGGKGRERVLRFSWRSFVKRIDDVAVEIISSATRPTVSAPSAEMETNS